MAGKIKHSWNGAVLTITNDLEPIIKFLSTIHSGSGMSGSVFHIISLK